MENQTQKAKTFIDEFINSLNPEKLEFRCFSYEPLLDDEYDEEQSTNTILSFDQKEIVDGQEFKKTITFTRIGNFDIELTIYDLYYIHESDLTNRSENENVINDSGLHFYKNFNLRIESKKLYLENLLLKLFKMVGRVSL